MCTYMIIYIERERDLSVKEKKKPRQTRESQRWPCAAVSLGPALQDLR